MPLQINKDWADRHEMDLTTADISIARGLTCYLCDKVKIKAQLLQLMDDPKTPSKFEKWCRENFEETYESNVKILEEQLNIHS
jgi:hypothetical protein